MEFQNLHADIDFSCTNKDVSENIKDIFTRKMKSSALQDDDFISYWEMGRRPPIQDKEKVCMSKGLSVNKYENDDDIRNLYNQLFFGASKFKRKKVRPQYYCKLKFKKGAGKVWLNGNRKPYHFTFFKSDAFNLSMVGEVQVEEF
jgi:hypothetical protein